MDSIIGCKHFNEKKNKLLILKFYIIHVSFISCQSENFKKATKILKKCANCEYKGSRLMSCLHCARLTCTMDLNEHFKEFKHCFYVNLISGYLFCVHCDDYTYDGQILSIADSLPNDVYSFGFKPFALKNICLLRTNNRIAYYNDTPVFGFVNLGNTCFLNSVLQVLMNTPMLRNYILSDRHVCPVIKESNRCIICEMHRIYQQAYVFNVGVISIEKFLKIFWDNTVYMASALQQDAHECLIALLDIIHRQAIKHNQNDKDIKHLENCQCIIHKMFKGVLQSDIVCQSCNNVSSKIDIINDIPIYFSMDERRKYPTTTNLMTCLEKFGQIELLNDLNCTNCQTKKLSSKQLTIKHLPMVMCFIIKRFGQPSDNVSNKITTTVEFLEKLDMGKFLAKKTITASALINECFAMYETVYTLYAVICHEGLAYGGHYLSYIRLTGKWYQCNDDVIKMVEFEDVLKSTAYLLFYHKEVMNLYS